MAFTGRYTIYSSATEITDENLWEELQAAFETHEINSREIDYLWAYKNGEQPILQRIKTIRPEIDNKFVVNRANQIIAFKKGYLLAEPIQYVSRKADSEYTDAVNQFNEYCLMNHKPAVDLRLAEWFYTAGVAYRFTFPNRDYTDGYSPFKTITMDPRYTFVVRDTTAEHKEIMQCHYSVDASGEILSYHVFTPSKQYVVNPDGSFSSKPYPYRQMPITEYAAGEAKLGAFEIVLGLLDQLNNMETNRADAIEQFVQHLIVFTNCDIDDQTFEQLQSYGGIKIKSTPGSPASVDIKTSELSQDQTQTFVDDLNGAVLEICGLPNRNGSSSTSDTGAAVIYRDGWSEAEARAKDTENCYLEPEQNFISLALEICREIEGTQLLPQDIDVKFTRRATDNIATKVQVLQILLQCGIDPQEAIASSGLFSDPASVYKKSETYLRDKWILPIEQSVEEPAGTDNNPVSANLPPTDGSAPSLEATVL